MKTAFLLLLKSRQFWCMLIAMTLFPFILGISFWRCSMAMQLAFILQAVYQETDKEKQDAKELRDKEMQQAIANELAFALDNRP
jgi:hypothetical protein